MPTDWSLSKSAPHAPMQPLFQHQEQVAHANVAVDVQVAVQWGKVDPDGGFAERDVLPRQGHSPGSVVDAIPRRRLVKAFPWSTSLGPNHVERACPFVALDQAWESAHHLGLVRAGAASAFFERKSPGTGRGPRRQRAPRGLKAKRP